MLVVFVRHYILLPFHSGDQELLLCPRIQSQCSVLLVHRADRSTCPTVSHSFLIEKEPYIQATILLIVRHYIQLLFVLSSRREWLKHLVMLLVQITVRTSTSQFARCNLLFPFRDQQLVSARKALSSKFVLLVNTVIGTPKRVSLVFTGRQSGRRLCSSPR